MLVLLALLSCVRSQPPQAEPGSRRLPSLPSPGCDAPPLVPELTWYEVTGRTRDEIRLSVQRSGPREAELERVGLTTSNVTWRCRQAVYSDGRREPVEVDVDLALTVLLPRWQRPSGATDEVAADWARWSGAVRRHEDGHVRITDAWLRCLEPVMEAEPDCKAAVAAGQGLVDRMQQAQIEFDRATAHGTREGIVW